MKNPEIVAVSEELHRRLKTQARNLYSKIEDFTYCVQQL